jgi:hypothetical protein
MFAHSSFCVQFTNRPNAIVIIDSHHPNSNYYLSNSNAHSIKAIPYWEITMNCTRQL